MRGRIVASGLALLLASVAPAPPAATAQATGVDALAIFTDVALARIAQSLLPLRFVVDGTGVTLSGVSLCPATGEHDVDLVGIAAPDGAPASAVPAVACTSALPAVASAAAAGVPAWRAAVRIRVGWSADTLRGAVADTALASGTPAAPAPDAAHLRATLMAAPLFTLDTRRLLALEFSGKTFALAAVPKFEDHRIVVLLMRDAREADARAAWDSLEADASLAVPAGTEAVVAATHPFLGRTLAEAFATPVEVYRTQSNVVTIRDVREAGIAGDIRASGEAVDSVSGVSGTITGEYAGTGDLTLRRIDVVPHDKNCSFVDFGCLANNVGMHVGAPALARQLMARYGNMPLRPTQPLAFPVALEGRTLTLSVNALQARSSALSLRIAGKLNVVQR